MNERSIVFFLKPGQLQNSKDSTHCNNIQPLKRPYLRTTTEKTWLDDAKVYIHTEKYSVEQYCQYGVIKLNGRHLFSMETTWFWSLRLCYARSLYVVTIVGCENKHNRTSFYTFIFWEAKWFCKREKFAARDSKYTAHQHSKEIVIWHIKTIGYILIWDLVFFCIIDSICIKKNSIKGMEYYTLLIKYINAYLHT